MADFVDFIVKVSKDQKLGTEFISMLGHASSAKEVADWLGKNGYQISDSEAEKIYTNRESIKNSAITETKSGY